LTGSIPTVNAKAVLEAVERAFATKSRYAGLMAADDRVVCPACFVILPPVKPEVVEVHCPRCHHVWDPSDELQQTVEQTPMAKRRSSRPG
jgi:hypothetical protein